MRPLPPYAGYSTAEEFDQGYDNFIRPQVVSHWEKIFREDSRRALGDAHDLRHLRYGPRGRNAIDFFPTRVQAGLAPVLIAIHGGLWFLFDKWFMHFLAPAINSAGVHVACVNYGLAPTHTLREIVEDCRNAVAYLARESDALAIDRSKMSVIGHSAAGQIAALVAATRWTDFLPETPTPVLHACIGVSGFYDIEPFPQTHFHQFTQFPMEQYQQLNPMRNVPSTFPPSLLITGAKESSLLQQMMQHFAAELETSRVRIETICAPDQCHFSVLHQIGEPDSASFRRVLKMVA